MTFPAFTFGDIKFPLELTATDITVAKIDPITEYLQNKLTDAIEFYCQNAWTKTVTRLGLNTKYPSPVAYTTHTSPYVYGDMSSLSFPLLYVQRGEQVLVDWTLSKVRSHSKYQITYYLFPMTPAQAENLEPYLEAVSKVIGSVVLLDNQTVSRVTRDVWTAAETNQTFPSITVHIEMDEDLEFIYENPEEHRLNSILSTTSDAATDPENPIDLATTLTEFEE